jgi:hypothetical protein
MQRSLADIESQADRDIAEFDAVMQRLLAPTADERLNELKRYVYAGNLAYYRAHIAGAE